MAASSAGLNFTIVGLLFPPLAKAESLDVGLPINPLSKKHNEKQVKDLVLVIL